MSFKLRYICWPLRVSTLYDLKFYKACCNRSYKYGDCVAWCRCCGICLMAKAKLICVYVRPMIPYEARPRLGPAQIASMAGPGTQFLHGWPLLGCRHGHLAFGCSETLICRAGVPQPHDCSDEAAGLQFYSRCRADRNKSQDNAAPGHEAGLTICYAFAFQACLPP